MSSQHVLGTLGGRGKWAAGNMDLEVRRGAQVGDPHKLVGCLWTSSQLGGRLQVMMVVT